MKKTTLFLLLAAALSASVYAKGADGRKRTKKNTALAVSSQAFRRMQAIPAQYTCDGDDISPALSWNGVPPAAKSVALIADDPDAPAGTWVHWVAYDLPPAAHGLKENVPKADAIAGGGVQGKNDFKRVGWNGPCPPDGAHRYFFKVYALDAMLDMPAGKTKAEIEAAMEGHVLAKGELVGTYTRR